MIRRALAPILLSVLLVGGCKKNSDEELVKAAIHRAVDAANERAASKVVADAAPDFRGPGGADTAECRRILLGYFLQQGWLHVFERSLEIHVEGPKARAVLGTVVAKGSEVKRIEDVLPTNGDVLDFDLTLEKQGGTWRFTNATFKSVVR